VDHVKGELPECCVVGCDRAARHFTIIVDIGQHSFLIYHSNLGLTEGVACWTVHRVYLVIQDAQVGYLLGSTEFCEWGGWFMGLDPAQYWHCRHGNSYVTDV
jgi:hypothetical protein